MKDYEPPILKIKRFAAGDLVTTASQGSIGGGTDVDVEMDGYSNAYDIEW